MFRPNVCFPPVCLTILRWGYQLKHLLPIVEDGMNHGVAFLGTQQKGFSSQLYSSLSMCYWTNSFSSEILLSLFNVRPMNFHQQGSWKDDARWHGRVGLRFPCVWVGLLGGVPNSCNSIFIWQWKSSRAVGILSSYIFYIFVCTLTFLFVFCSFIHSTNMYWCWLGSPGADIELEFEEQSILKGPMTMKAAGLDRKRSHTASWTNRKPLGGSGADIAHWSYAAGSFGQDGCASIPI